MTVRSENLVREFLDDCGFDYEIVPCDPELADTTVFCQHYGYALELSANTIIVKAKTGEERFVACVVLANTRLDVNKVVRKRLAARRVSFASADETREVTGMELGGVTPLALPVDLPVWIDQRVMSAAYIVLGSGNRSTKIKIAPKALLQIPGATVVENLATDRT
jgi:prolyl-tRNA editing enzyme YbaK/EbsC (Cys-tRNA(Pro) deacylase)